VEAEEHGEGHDDGEESQRHRGARRRHAPPPPLPRRGRGGGRRSRALHPAPHAPRRSAPPRPEQRCRLAGGRRELPRGRATKAGRPVASRRQPRWRRGRGGGGGGGGAVRTFAPARSLASVFVRRIAAIVPPLAIGIIFRFFVYSLNAVLRCERAAC
jgi:hypothetical protein